MALLIVVTLQFVTILCLACGWCCKDSDGRNSKPAVKVEIQNHHESTRGTTRHMVAPAAGGEMPQRELVSLAAKFWQTKNSEVVHLDESCGYLKNRNYKPVLICQQCKRLHEQKAEKAD